MGKTDTNAKKENHHEAEVIQGLGPVKGGIGVEAGSGRSLDPGVEIGRNHDPEAEIGKSHDPGAGTENGESGLVPAQDQDTGIGLEAGVEQEVGVEIEKRELKNQEDLAEV